MKEDVVFKNQMVFTDNRDHMWEIDFLKENKTDDLCFMNKRVNDSFLKARDFMLKNHPELML